MFNNILDLKEIPKIFENDKLLHQAFDISEFLALSKDKQFAYQQDLKARLDYQNVMDYAIEVAMEEGHEEGKRVRNIEIVKTSLLQGIDIKTIALITGLSIDEIKNI